MKHRGRVIAGFFAGLLVTAGVLTLAQQQNNQQQNNQSTQSKAGNQSTQPSASGAAASGTEGSAEKPLMVVSATAGIKGTVTDVSRLRRTVEIKTEDGKTATIKVGKEVKNFGDLKKGDEVNITYHESTVVALRKAGGEPPSARIGHALLTPPNGGTPAVEVTTVETAAAVERIDAEKRTITLKAPDGGTRTMKVGEDVNLKDVKVGDQVAVRTTEAVAIDINKRRA